jgi:very-short-patch-repair endonuclease
VISYIELFPLRKGVGGLIFNIMNSHYNKNLKEKARYLRSNSTPGEITLWNKVLKNKKMHNFQFLRQFPIENYIVDFICRKAKLIIEIDGYSHNFKYDEDMTRDQHLRELGYTVVRFREKDIKININNVIKAIEHHLSDPSIPLPPLPRGKSQNIK